MTQHTQQGAEVSSRALTHLSKKKKEKKLHSYLLLVYIREGERERKGERE